MAKEKLLAKVIVPLTESALEQIKTYGAEVRAASLAHAARRLIEDGLEQWRKKGE